MLIPSKMPITATRFPKLAVVRVAGHIWRYVCRESTSDAFDPYTGCVGYSYRTKTEAMADLERFARDFGLTGGE